MPVKISTLTPISPADSDKLEVAQYQGNGVWATKAVEFGQLKAAAALVTSVVGETGTVSVQEVRDALNTIAGLDADTLDSNDGTFYLDADNHVYDNATSGLTATDVQAAIDEVEQTVDSLTANAVRLAGTWDASTGSFPTGASNGDTYVVSTGGTVAGVVFKANDRLLALADNPIGAGDWIKLDYTDQVLSVAGKTGAVTLSVSDLTNGSTVVRSSDLEANGGTIPQIDNAAQYTRQQNFAAQSLTDAATISWNLNTQQAANVTLGGDRTLANPTNMVDGGTYTLIVRQDGTGGRSLSYGTAYKWPSGNPPTLTQGANAVDILTFLSDGASMFGVVEYNFV